MIDLGVIIFLLAAALPIVPGVVCDTADAEILHKALFIVVTWTC